MTFDNLIHQLNYLNIAVDQKNDGVTYLKKNGKVWMLINPKGPDGKTCLETNDAIVLDVQEVRNFLGALRIVNKYMQELDQDHKRLFCKEITGHDLESGDVIQTNCGNYLITWGRTIKFPVYSVVDLDNSRVAACYATDIKSIGKCICQLAKENNEDVENIKLYKIYVSATEYFANMKDMKGTIKQ